MTALTIIVFILSILAIGLRVCSLIATARAPWRDPYPRVVYISKLDDWSGISVYAALALWALVVLLWG